jgi:predicted protein tyrosine phosphatase
VEEVEEPMNFTFEITCYEGAEDRLLGLDDGPAPDHLISINSPGQKPPRGSLSFEGNKLFLAFLDLRTEADDCWYDARGWGHLRRPEPEDVARIIEFGKIVGAEGGHLLVHCAAGISRSTAATLIVMATQRTPEDALHMGLDVFLNRPIARPNDLMLKFADEQLGWGGALAALGGETDSEVNFLWAGVG